jgi:hypothetical protein
MDEKLYEKLEKAGHVLHWLGKYDESENEFEALIKKYPVAMAVMGLLALNYLSTPLKNRPEIPGLGGRRNGSWRGKGSYGHAPFGKQSSHRSR